MLNTSTTKGENAVPAIPHHNSISGEYLTATSWESLSMLECYSVVLRGILPHVPVPEPQLIYNVLYRTQHWWY
jgi:hypothetical protein